MTRKLTSIRLDEEMLNEFILENAKRDELMSKVLGMKSNQASFSNMNTTDMIHLAIAYATSELKERNEQLLKRLEEKDK